MEFRWCVRDVRLLSRLWTRELNTYAHVSCSRALYRSSQSGDVPGDTSDAGAHPRLVHRLEAFFNSVFLLSSRTRFREREREESRSGTRRESDIRGRFQIPSGGKPSLPLLSKACFCVRGDTFSHASDATTSNTRSARSSRERRESGKAVFLASNRRR